MTPATTAAFFAELAERGHEPLLHAASGTVRFDLRDGENVERWLVAIDRGTVSVTRKREKADCVVFTDRRLFDRIVTGQANAMTAFLRGLIGLEGDPQLLLLFQRLFPGPAQPGTETEDRRALR
jgi:putative sterol carrier protein